MASGDRLTARVVPVGLARRGNGEVVQGLCREETAPPLMTQACEMDVHVEVGAMEVTDEVAHKTSDRRDLLVQGEVGRCGCKGVGRGIQRAEVEPSGPSRGISLHRAGANALLDLCAGVSMVTGAELRRRFGI